MNIKFLGCWVFNRPAIIAFGFSNKIQKKLPPCSLNRYMRVVTLTKDLNVLFENCYSNHVPELPNLVSVRGFLYCKPRLIRDNLREKWKKGDHKFAIWCGNSTTYLAKSDLSTKKPQPICFGQASLRILIAKRHVICTHIGTKSSYLFIFLEIWMCDFPSR